MTYFSTAYSNIALRIAQSTRPRVGLPRNRASIPGARGFPVFQSPYIGTEAHPASYPMGTRGKIARA